MADTTIGQRIGERRRLLGISQEALGEKLGVSRQAISKWESDSAVPEIDKLIALSRLFGVSVGWLLGTEQEMAPDAAAEEGEAKAAQPPDAAEEGNGPQTPEFPGKLRWIGAGLCLILVVAVLALWASLAGLRNTVENIQWQVSQLQNDNNRLRGELSSLDSSLQELLTSREKENDMFSLVSCQVRGMEDSDEGAVSITMVPKAWTEGDQAELTVLREGQTVRRGQFQWDGATYALELQLPPENGYEYYCTLIHGDGTRQQQRLACEEAENVGRQLRITGSAMADSSTLEPFSGEAVLRDISLSVFMPESLIDSRTVCWTACDFVFYKNEQELDRVSPPGLLTDDDRDRSTEFHASVEQVEFRFGEMQEGDALEIWLETALSNGLTGRTYVEGWIMLDGEITSLEVVGPD